MAARPIFLPGTTACGPVRVETIEFTWHAGLSKSQKQRSIEALHDAGKSRLAVGALLEISSKSKTVLGTKLSAFRLCLGGIKNKPVTVEGAFQGSKVFEHGGPYTDLLTADPAKAKRDPRLHSSGRLVRFHANGADWPLEPKTLFYDWMYIRALLKHPDLSRELMRYDGFTDIEFNPSKSFSCQAHAAALYVQLVKHGVLEHVMSTVDTYVACLGSQDEGVQNNGQLVLF